MNGKLYKWPIIYFQAFFLSIFYVVFLANTMYVPAEIFILSLKKLISLKSFLYSLFRKFK